MRPLKFPIAKEEDLKSSSSINSSKKQNPQNSKNPQSTQDSYSILENIRNYQLFKILNKYKLF